MTTLQPSTPQQYIGFDEYIDAQLQKTRASIKWTDILTAALGLAVLVLAYLLVFVVFDHWIVPGGFSRTARLVMLGVVAVAGVLWTGWKVVRPYMRSVNRLYAARELEKADPTLRSTLLNLVDAQQAGREVSPAIRSAMEKRAALTLSNADVDRAIDRRTLLMLCYGLLAVVVLWTAYTVFSPKKISTSIWRALAPGSAAVVDTRTDIITVSPGNTEVLTGQFVEVTVDLGGEVPERVLLRYTTDDQAFVDAEVELRAIDETSKRFRGLLSGANGDGLRGPLSYYIVAGDATSEVYRVEIIQPPTATVESVTYDFPDYMEADPDPRTDDGGQIDAHEGTEVTVRVTFDQPIARGSLHLTKTEAVGDSADEYTLRAVDNSKTTWEGKFTLSMWSDGTRPYFYYIDSADERGYSDPEPALYPLTIHVDRAPEVEILAPTTDIERPRNAKVPITLKTRDPDFQLRYVTLKVYDQLGDPIENKVLLDELSPTFEGQGEIDLSKLPPRIKVGDHIFVQIEARDNKRINVRGIISESNRTTVPATPGLKITLTEPISEEEAEQQAKRERQQQREQLDGDQPENNDQNAERAPREGEPQQGEPQEGGEDGGERQPGEGDQPQEGEPNRNGQGEGSRSADDREGMNEGEPGTEGEGTGERQPNGSGKGSESATDSDMSDPDEADRNRSGEGSEGQRDGSGDREQPLDDKGQDDQEVLEKLREFQKKQREREEQQRREEEQNNPQPDSGQQPPSEDGNTGGNETGEDKQQGSDSNSEGGSDPNQSTPRDDAETERGSDPNGMGETEDGGGNENTEEGSVDNPNGTDDANTNDRDSQRGTDREGMNPDADPERKGEPRPNGDREGTDDADPNGRGEQNTSGDPNTDPDGMTDPNAERNPNGSGNDRDPNAEQRPREDGDGTGSGERRQADDTESPEDVDGMRKGETNPDGSPRETEGMTDPKNGTGAEEKTGAEENAGTNRTPEDTEKTPQNGEGGMDNASKPDGEGEQNAADPNKRGGAEADPDRQPMENGPGEGDPKTGSEQRPDESDNAEGTANDGGTDNPRDADPTAPKKTDPAAEENPDARPSETTPNPKDDNRSETSDQPNAGNPEMKNPEQSPRKSDQPDGGENGNSTQSDQGNKGNQTGSGDSTDEAGTNEKSDSPTGRQGEEQGEGSETRPSDDPNAKADPNAKGEPQPSENADPDNARPKESPNGKGEPSDQGDPNGAPENKTPQQGDPSQGTDSETPPEGQSQDSENPGGMEKGSQPQSDPKGGQKPSGDQNQKGESQQGGNQPEGQPNGKNSEGQGESPSQSDAEGPGQQPGKSGRNGTGGNRNGEASSGSDDGPAPLGEAADLENGKQAANLVLDRLKDQLDRGEVSPELLDELGWTPDQLQKWSQRMQSDLDNLDRPVTEPTAQQRQEALKEKLIPFGQSRTGEGVKPRNAGGMGPRDIPVPARYRKYWEAYTKGITEE